MNSEKSKKRLVSKEDYVRILGRTVTLTGLSVICLSTGIFLLLGAAILGVAILGAPRIVGSNGGSVHLFVILGIAGTLLWIGSKAKRQVETSEPVAPVTRKTLDQLPAEESLVRAAAEPIEKQQAVL